MALAEAGADILELGPPYSDPVMDGAVIQEATQAALAAGFRLRDTFTAVRAIAARVDVPILVMTYWNPVMQYGVDRFCASLAGAGGAGLMQVQQTLEPHSYSNDTIAKIVAGLALIGAILALTVVVLKWLDHKNSAK